MADALRNAFPASTFAFSQYIQDNVQEAASGIDAENAIKIIGADLDTLHKIAIQIRPAIEGVRGITDIQVPPLLGQPTIRIDIDRDRAARYGLSPGDINATIQAAVGGQEAGDLYEDGSDRHFPMLVRLAPQYRHSMEAIRQIAIGVQGGGRCHPGAAERAGEDPARLRCLLHLPRAAGALYPGQVQRARARPGRRRAGSPAEGRRHGRCCRAATASNGPAISPTSRARSSACRSQRRSPSP